MADMYSKLLGLSDTTTPPAAAKKEKPPQASQPQEKKTRVLANQQTSKPVKIQPPQQESKPAAHPINASKSPSPEPEKTTDTSLLSTKEKTKYGTYLTDESIQKISIRAIQTGRDAHQIVQEAVNQYLERLEK